MEEIKAEKSKMKTIEQMDRRDIKREETIETMIKKKRK